VATPLLRLATLRRLPVKDLPVQATKSPRRPLARRLAPLTLRRRHRTRLLLQLTAGTRSLPRLHRTHRLRRLTRRLPRLTLPRRRTTVRHRQLRTRPAARRRPSTLRRPPTTARLRRRHQLTPLPRQHTRRLLPSMVVQEPAVHHPRLRATHPLLPCTARVATAIRPHHRRTALLRRSIRLTRQKTTRARVPKEPIFAGIKENNQKHRLPSSLNYAFSSLSPRAV
jgi:hypothetical protein